MADPLVLIGRIHPADVAAFVESVAESWRHLTEWKWTGRVPSPAGSGCHLPHGGSGVALETLEQDSSSSSGAGGQDSWLSGPPPADSPGWKWVKCGAMPKRLPNMHTVWYGAVFDVDAELRLAASEAELTALITAANAPIFQVTTL